MVGRGHQQNHHPSTKKKKKNKGYLSLYADNQDSDLTEFLIFKSFYKLKDNRKVHTLQSTINSITH